jgi:hypothetical protein
VANQEHLYCWFGRPLLRSPGKFLDLELMFPPFTFLLREFREEVHQAAVLTERVILA